MIRQLYTVPFAGVAVTAVQDLFYLLAPTTSRLALCRIEVFQTTDVGDAASEHLAYTIKRAAAGTVGSGGNAATPVPVKGHTNAKVAATTARINDTTQATGGSPVTVLASAFSIFKGLIYAPRYGASDDTDERITVEAGGRIVLSLDTAPADSLTMHGTLMFEELGLV
jgi:hypothetical protein